MKLEKVTITNEQKTIPKYSNSENNSTEILKNIANIKKQKWENNLPLD
uniref:Uncharacterized protein n=1 Tax=Rhizophora mucronata TaxID=61149 RepID=A0A2P2QC01_RHIMU